MLRAIANGLVLISLGQPCFADVNCPNTEFEYGYREELPIVDKPEMIGTDAPLFENGNIICQVGPDYSNHKQNIRHRIEIGTLGEIKYRIYYSDGSGTIQGDPASTLDIIKDLNLKNWSIACKVDGMDDKRWCYISKENLTIGLWKDGSTFVNIGHDHYPSSQIAIRIDKNTPISASERNGFSNKQIADILSSLQTGQKALTRYQEWPYQSNKDVSIDLYGFNEAWKILNAVYKAN